MFDEDCGSERVLGVGRPLDLESEGIVGVLFLAVFAAENDDLVLALADGGVGAQRQSAEKVQELGPCAVFGVEEEHIFEYGAIEAASVQENPAVQVANG